MALKPNIFFILLILLLSLSLIFCGFLFIIKNVLNIYKNIFIIINGIAILYLYFLLNNKLILINNKGIYINWQIKNFTQNNIEKYDFTPWSSINSISSSFPYWWPYKSIVLRSDYKSKASYFPLEVYYTNFNKALLFIADKVPRKCFDEHSWKLVEIYRERLGSVREK